MKQAIINFIFFTALLCTAAANGGIEQKTGAWNVTVRDRDFLIVRLDGVKLYPAPPAKDLIIQNYTQFKLLEKGTVLKITDLTVVTNPGPRQLQGVWLGVRQVLVPEKAARNLDGQQAGAIWTTWIQYAADNTIASIDDQTVAAFMDRHRELFTLHFSREEVSDLLVLMEYYFSLWRINPANLAADVMENNWQQFVKAYAPQAAPLTGWFAKNELTYAQ